MRRELHFARHWGAFRRLAAFILAVLAFAFALASAAVERTRFAPRFVSGESLRYRIETRSTNTGKTTTPIADPEGESKFTQSMSLLVRLDVLGVSRGAQNPGQVRFRATYEKSHAESASDAFDPNAVSLADQYARLEGQSVEFTMEPNAQLADLKGLEDIFPNRSPADPILSWVQTLSTGTRFPRDGVSLGQKWSGERALTGSPLSGFVWRTESSYLRDDPCEPSNGANLPHKSAAGDANSCAVILTRFEILRHGPSEAQDTPEEYRRNGLRTSGVWTGSGQSLDSISLASGILESSTQTSSQNMDYEIESATTHSRIHHVGQMESQSEITLVPDTGSRP
jgi:hypothetical protein